MPGRCPMKENLKMSIREAERLSIMRQIDKKILTLRKASEELGISLRQTKRVRKRYLENGEKGLISFWFQYQVNHQRKVMSEEKKLRIRNSTIEFLIFTGQAGENSIEVRIAEETVWLTQKLMGVLFEVSVPTINEHLS